MLQVIFYHVGKGDMSLVLLPNGEAMLVDCYRAVEVADAEITGTDSVLDRVEAHIIEHRDKLSRTTPLLLEAVAKEKAKTKKVPIAVLAVTHADRDHIISREKLKSRFDIGLLIDSGRDYGDPSEAQKDYVALREEMRRASRYTAITRAAFNLWPQSGATIDALCPNRDIDENEDNNNQCLILRIEYQGRSFLMTGDSPLADWVDEKTGILKLHTAKIHAEVLNVSHHGSRSFFTPSGARPEGQPDYEKEDFDTRALEAIRPTLSFITCSDDEDADHPHPIALELYQELTNQSLPGSGKSHVILSRDSQHMHHVVDTDGRLYLRTSRSRTNRVNIGAPSAGPYLVGSVSGPNGRLTTSGVWVSLNPLDVKTSLSFTVTAKGKWTGPISFDWWVLNNGQGADEFHREFYTMESSDRKKHSSWSRDLRYAGVHIMQCHASTEDKACWANWCVLICHADSLPYAERWLQLYPGCVDPSKINRGW